MINYGHCLAKFVYKAEINNAKRKNKFDYKRDILKTKNGRTKHEYITIINSLWHDEKNGLQKLAKNIEETLEIEDRLIIRGESEYLKMLIKKIKPNTINIKTHKMGLLRKDLVGELTSEEVDDKNHGDVVRIDKIGEAVRKKEELQPFIEELENSSFLARFGLLDKQTIKGIYQNDWYNKLSERPGENIILIQSVEGEAIGIASFAEKKGIHKEKIIFVDIIGVRESFRGKGVGKTLLNRVINHAREKGCEQIMLAVSISNQKAIGLYRRMGFRRIGGCDTVLVNRISS